MMMAPGPGDEPVNTAGKVLDRDKYRDMLREYYRLRGLDEDSGLPKKETLSALGMSDLYQPGKRMT